MATLAEVDDVAAAARYIGKYLHMQWYHVRKYNYECWLGVPRLGILVKAV